MLFIKHLTIALEIKKKHESYGEVLKNERHLITLKKGSFYSANISIAIISKCLNYFFIPPSGLQFGNLRGFLFLKTLIFISDRLKD